MTQSLLVNSVDVAMASAAIGLAHSLNLAVVAQGVDELSQLEKLANLGCDRYQGALLNQPCDEPTIETLLSRSQVISLDGMVE